MRPLAIVFAFVVAMNLMAYGKMDVASRLRLKSISAIVEPDSVRYVPVVIKLASADALASLDSKNVKLIRKRDELVLAFVPRDSMEAVLEMASVSSISIGREVYPSIDKAVEMANVDDVALGKGIAQPFDGSGVVIGFSDIGFDPNHVNFLDSIGRPSRIKRLVNYVDTLGLRIELSETEEIARWRTDRETEFHATHVAGILTGSCQLNNMQGVAPKSHVVATTSDLYDATILAGVEDVIEYAGNVGKPAVVNLSLGSYVGPHDGTDLFCQYLDKLGEEAVICIAAGNNGHRRNVHSVDFTASLTEYKTFINDYIKWDGMHLYGHADFWSADCRPFQLSLCIYDRTDGVFLYHSPVIGVDGERAEWDISDVGDASGQSDIFNRCFDGYVHVGAEHNVENNRYNVMVSYNVKSTEYHTDGVLSRYCLGIVLRASEGVHVDGYSDGVYSYFVSHGVAGFAAGQSAGSISGIACGKNVLVVGSSNSRNVVPLVSGGVKSYDFSVGAVSDYTGYGTLLDGRQLPHVCAPGNMVVSSVSSPYVAWRSGLEPGYAEKNLALKTDFAGREYYWLSECGTSMATPLVAGIVALWLQADPTLSIDEVRDIAMSTTAIGGVDAGDPRWGAGNIDALSGIKEVMRRAGVSAIDVDKRVLFVNLGYNRYAISCVDSQDVNVRVYSMDGSRLMTEKLAAEGVLELSVLPCGVYLLEVETGDSYRCVKRVVVS